MVSFSKSFSKSLRLARHSWYSSSASVANSYSSKQNYKCVRVCVRERHRYLVFFSLFTVIYKILQLPHFLLDICAHTTKHKRQHVNFLGHYFLVRLRRKRKTEHASFSSCILFKRWTLGSISTSSFVILPLSSGEYCCPTHTTRERERYCKTETSIRIVTKWSHSSKVVSMY